MFNFALPCSEYRFCGFFKFHMFGFLVFTTSLAFSGFKIFVSINITSFRLLVFSNEEVLSVSVRVDDNLGHWITCQHRSGPLYTAIVDLQLEAWDPQVSEKDFVKNLQVGTLSLEEAVFVLLFLCF